MDEATVIRRLEAIEPPGLGEARRHAAEAIPARLASAPRRTSRPLPRPSLRPVTAGLALCVALMAFLVLTPPGQAFTSWVGDRIGFGEPGGHPTLRQLRRSWSAGTVAAGRPAYVLATGSAPGRQRYEFIAYRPKPSPAAHGPAGPCFELDLTQERSMATGGCGTFPEGPDLYAGFGGNSQPGRALFEVSGRATTDASSVEARFDGRPLPVELQPVRRRLLGRLGLGEPFEFFIAFLPGVPTGGTLAITARDSRGRAIARRRLELPDVAAGTAALHRALRTVGR